MLEIRYGRAGHGGVGAHAQEHGVVLGQQLVQRHISADVGVQAELDAHVFLDVAAGLDHLLFQLEGRNAEGQQAADLGVAVIDHGLHAIARQDVGAAKASGSGADDRDLLAGGFHPRHVRPPALLEGLVRDVFFDGADGDRAEAVVERTGAFAQPVLRAHPAADFGQRVGLVAELGGGEQVAFLHHFQPVGNVVVHRALPLAVGVAAVEATPRLGGRLLGGKLPVDLAPVVHAHFDRRLPGVLTGDFEKLEVILCHAKFLGDA